MSTKGRVTMTLKSTTVYVPPSQVDNLVKKGYKVVDPSKSASKPDAGKTASKSNSAS